MRPVTHPSGGRPAAAPAPPPTAEVTPTRGGDRLKLYPEGDECPWWERNEDYVGPFGKKTSSIFTNMCKGGGVAKESHLKQRGFKLHPTGAWADQLIINHQLIEAEREAAKIVFGHEEL